jgi:hypothetical protein
VPLRTYPPLPKLQVAKAVQPTGIGSIAQALTWTAAVNVERSGADQDTLNLSLTFNELLTVAGPTSAMRAEREGREPPTDLFAALARFVTEYPQLRLFIEALERQVRRRRSRRCRPSARSLATLPWCGRPGSRRGPRTATSKAFAG